MSNHWDVVVVGAGAAGMMAASRAARRGRRTLILEKNNKVGVKILMSGGTRCNITQATDRKGIARAYGDQGKFLRSPLAALGPDEVIAFFHDAGVSTKVESTGKVFPVSDSAVDVQRAMLAEIRSAGAELELAQPLSSLTKDGEYFQLQTESKLLSAENVILTTGGKSYPGCGTTGDGYAWSKSFGHNIVPPRPALVPLTTNATWVLDLKGITIDDVELTLIEHDTQPHEISKRSLERRRGSFLFTHFGLSGPAVMDLSRAVTGYRGQEQLALACDFLPEMKAEQLDAFLVLQSQQSGKRSILAAVCELFPRRLATTVCDLANVDGETRASELRKSDRRQLVIQCKSARVPIVGTRGFKKAEVTAGGVSLDEIDSRTMQSKLVDNLYIAGELLDLDGPIGGYNFQAAFSTGFVAGESA